MNNYTTAIKASIDAGLKILEVYDSPFEVIEKEDKSPLTKADQEANTIINQLLVNTEFPIISEENKQTSFEERKEWGTCWIVDPLDGTKEFVKRNGEFTVNIALVENGNPIFGVIYVPVSKDLYVGDVTNRIAYKCSVATFQEYEKLTEQNKQQLPIETMNSDLTRVVGSKSHMNETTQNYISELEKGGKEVSILSKGSSLKFCLVAEGKADVYPRFAPTMEWDTAAGQAICEAAGVEVIDNNTGKPLKYNKENLLNPHFLVSK